MKKRILLFVTLMMFFGPHRSAASDICNSKDEGKSKIGIYDSRIIAVAYSRTDEFTETIRELSTGIQTAKTSGDEIQIIGLEKSMAKLQDILQKQAFSTYPVTEILVKVKDKLPEIAEKYGVSCIVNKWEVMYLDESTEVVDVTLDLARLFFDSENLNQMYPPTGIPEPESLMKMEGLTNSGGIDEEYVNGPNCSVKKKDLKAALTESFIIGKWKAVEWYVHETNMLGSRNFYFTFNPDKSVKVEENENLELEGTWILGVNENSMLLQLTKEGSTFSGRYDLDGDQLVISGKGIIGANEYVCIRLKKQP